MMRKLTKLTFILVLGTYMSTAQISTPAPSPAGSVSSTVGLTEVTIDYFRPSVKGRQIFGTGDDFLLQYGELWRTGANSGTKLTVSTDANIGGTDVEAGTYLVVSVPGADEFEFMLYSDPSIGGGISQMEDDKIVLKTKVPVTKFEYDIETMTFAITNISADNTSADIWFGWENTVFTVPVKVSYDEMVVADIESKMKPTPATLIQAANYYFNTGKDMDKALKWMNMYFEAGDYGHQFWNIHTKAAILAKLGRDKEAIETAEMSLKKAEANENGDFGYIKRNKDLIAEIKGK